MIFENKYFQDDEGRTITQVECVHMREYALINPRFIGTATQSISHRASGKVISAQLQFAIKSPTLESAFANFDAARDECARKAERDLNKPVLLGPGGAPIPARRDNGA